MIELGILDILGTVEIGSRYGIMVVRRRLLPDDVKTGDVLEVSIDGKAYTCKVGDYVPAFLAWDLFLAVSDE